MPSHPKAGLGPQAQSHTVRSRLDDLARRYYAPLATFFRKRTHNAAEVQDLVQQVFLRLAQHHRSRIPILIEGGGIGADVLDIECPSESLGSLLSSRLSDRELRDLDLHAALGR